MTPVVPKPSRWKCTCAYDGTAFAGWQSQAKSDAIQDVIEACLAAIFKQPIRIHGSGRTDAGVHALGQVFHFDAAWGHGARKLLAAFRMGLPPEISVKAVQPIPADFHARFDATGKRYEYRIQLGAADPFQHRYCWTVFRPLDLAAMKAAAELLRGRHDFESFTALNGSQREDSIRDLRRFEVVRRGRSIRIVAEADGFLYKMMRSLVGALVSVGEGKLSLSQLREILKAKERTHRILTAPPQGLFLVRVRYAK
ncbi:MAG: tRNA pseudouridine synthase [Verrucomicrobia bacterium]|nr:tRNA pseudouridine synthase [Verrucomicrobiota bacterium]